MGNYVNQNLIKDERVEHESTLHWITFCNVGSVLTLFIAPLIAMKTSEFAITNKRLIVKTGFLSSKTLEMNLSKIESVNVDQGLLGRILGYGTLKITGSGGTKEVFPKIVNPLEFRKKFQELSN
ncbi:MAG: PH domain-containing protein [Bacteroidota bacterium]